MIAFLGMGLLGSGFVRALLERGDEVQVWNRSAGKAAALESAGAVACVDPASAVRGAEPVLTVDDLCVEGAPSGVSFQAFPGEILGFAGLIGSTEFCGFQGVSRGGAKETGYADQHST